MLDSLQQSNIRQYTEECLDYYKKTSQQIYSMLFSCVSNGNYILCIGMGRKVVNAEQEAAKKGLDILNLDQNY
jgi:hypothetical protein